MAGKKGTDRRVSNSKAAVVSDENLVVSQLFVKKDRAIKIIKEMSEFLRILDLRETEILKTMIVRFAIESVEAVQGSLVVWDENRGVLKYQDTYVYDNNNKIILDTTVFEGYANLLDIGMLPGDGIIGEAYEKGSPIIVEKLSDSRYPKPVVAEVMNLDIESVIVVPLKISNEVIALLEVTQTRQKPPLSSDDLETIMIIANFASTILENAKHYLWAIHDSLTGLYNNHYFFKIVQDEIEKSRRYGRVFSIVMFDIDDFKKINDTFGHRSGDLALQSIADSISKTIRKEVDVASRYGGDEFVMIFPNTPAEIAARVCERLLSLVRGLKVKSADGREFSLTLSLGIAEFPRDGEEQYYIIENADKSLYASKRAGKNRLTVYSPELSDI